MSSILCSIYLYVGISMSFCLNPKYILGKIKYDHGANGMPETKMSIAMLLQILFAHFKLLVAWRKCATAFNFLESV